MKLKRKWPLVITASVMLAVPLMLALAIVLVGIKGEMNEALEASRNEMTPWHYLWALVVFVYPLYTSIQFLFFGKKSESVLGQLSCIVLLLAYLLIFYPIRHLGVTPNQTIGFVVFAVAAGFAYLFHRFLKSYCFGSPNQSR